MRCRLSSIFALLLLILTASVVRAGGGPQNVLVVVNAASPESLEIGNAYRRIRNIPYRQLLTIKTTTAYAIPYQTYVDDIETPIETYLKSQQLEDEVTCIVLTRGIPQQVLIENGRSTASLLSTLGMNNAYARCPNPYFNMPVGFSHRPSALHGMYLVTTLSGYNVQDVEHMIAQGAAADGTAPTGRFLLQTSSNYQRAVFSKVTDLLSARSFTADIITAPPAETTGLMGYFSGGIYSGLTKDSMAALNFHPGAIADIVQGFSAAANNFDESATPIMMPLGWLVRAGVSGVHGVVGEAGINTFPLTANAQTLFDRYTSGFSLAESFYAALPVLNWQNVILGDPLCSPYAKRPTVSIDAGTAQPLKDIVPVRITAASSVRGTTISRIDVYLDDQFMQTLYEPESTNIVLRVGEHSLEYTVPRGASLRVLLEGLAEAINKSNELKGPDGVSAVVSLNTGMLYLFARTPGEAGNDQRVSVSLGSEKQEHPVVTIRMDRDQLAGGGVAPTPAKATISFVGRRIKPTDEITLQIQKEKLTYTVPEDKVTISDLLDALVNLIETSPALNGPRGVHAYRDPNGMPFITLEARTPGESGNAIAFQLTVKASEGSSLRGYPDTLAYLSDGHNGSTANLGIQFALGEPTIRTTYLLKTTELVDGYHRLHVVAYEGSSALVQGFGDLGFNVQNNPNPPIVTLPEKIDPACGEVSVPVDATPDVKRVDLFIDGQLVGSGSTAPFAVRVPLTNLGRGTHDLWAEGFDADGNSYVTPPIPLDVQVPPEVLRITPDHTVQAGGSTHRVIGNGFQPDCTVQLAGVPARSVKYLNPNMLEVVSDAGPARQGSVQVTNPDHTQSTLSTRFEYYTPRVARITISPDQDLIAPGVKAQFTAQCADQFGHPIKAEVVWEAAGGGAISPTGLFTAPEKPGKYTVRATHPDCRQPAEAPLIVGTDEVHDGRLRQWLIAGPFPDADHAGLDAKLLDEAALAPAHGEPAKDCAWQSINSKRDYIDFSSYFTTTTNVVAYAHLYLNAPAATPCQLVFGSDDGIRIWLNGDRIYDLHVHRSADPNQNKQDITLQPGWNRLLVKVDQEAGGWGFFMRLLTPDGKPLTGIQYALDQPPAAEKPAPSPAPNP